MNDDHFFVGLDTGTIEQITDQSRIVWLGDIDPRDLTGDDYFDDETMIELAGQRGVPLSELIDAWNWREGLIRAGVLDEVEDHIVHCFEDMDDEQDDAEQKCADCLEQFEEWAEEAPQFRLCHECCAERVALERDDVPQA